MNESSLWEELRDTLAGYWHASRVESHSTSAGIPDVDYCIDGFESHVELKFSKGSKVPNIRNTQVRWHIKRHEHGGTSFILTKIKVDGLWHYLFHKGSQAAELKANSDIDYWLSTSIHISLDNLDAEDTIKILRNK